MENKIKFVNQSDLYTAVLEIWVKACDKFSVKGYIRVQPTANSLTYTGVAQALCTAGTGSGTIVYSLDGSTYTTTIPSQTNAGTYTVYYKALSSFDSTESPVYTLSCGIDKATPTVVVPTAKVLTYNGSAQELLNAGSTDFGTFKYSLDNSTWSTSIPTATNGGSYTAYYKVEGDSNINDVVSASVQCSINEKLPTITIELSQDTYTYDGTAKIPTVTVKDGFTIIDPSEYTVVYSNNINAGTATVTISDNVGGNYEVIGSTTFTIGKAQGEVTIAPTAIEGLTHTGSAQALVNTGSGTGIMMYNLDGGDWSSSIPTATNVGSYTVGYKAAESANYTESTTSSVSVTIAVAKAKLYDYLYEDGSFGKKDATKTAIGVCVIPGGVLPDGKARFMSLKEMKLTSPNEGGSDTGIYWGGHGSDIPTLTNYTTVVTGDTTAEGTDGNGYVPKNGSYSSTPHIPSPIDYFSAYSSAGATSDLDGKANTEKILAVDNTASTAWQTAASIKNSSSTATVHPAAQCCWRFNPGSTNQGDWYLPSIGELAFIMPNFNDLRTAISDVSGVQLDGYGRYWSSTEYGGNLAWGVYASSGNVYGGYKYSDNYVRAFLAL